MAPNDPCETCAFGQGGGAAEEPRNRLKGQICALGALPFMCHHAPDGRELNWQGTTAEFYSSMRSRRDMRLCAGWKREVAEYRRRGFFGKYREIRHAIARAALDSLAEFLALDRPTPQEAQDKEWARRTLWKQLRFLVRKNIGPLKIPLLRRPLVRR